MADNFVANAGSGGDTFAADEIGGVKYPRSKIVIGADNSNDGDVSSANPLPVDLGGNNDVTIDGSSIVQTEDAVHGSGDAGVMALGVRNDTLAALAGTDGDYAPLQVDASGALYIQEGSALDVSGATVTVSGTVTANAGTGTFTIQEAAAMDVSAATVTVDLGANNDVTIDGSSIVHAEDAVHNTGDAGVMALSVRNDTLAALGGTDGDYAPLQVNATGALYVQEGAALDVSGATVTVDNGGTFAVQVDAALPAGTNAIGKLAANSGVDIGDVDVTSISAGSNLIGDVGISGARTSGGTSFFYSNDLDQTEETVKGSAGQVYWIHAMNLSASLLYLQVFNNTSVTVGVTTPDLEFPLATQGDTNGAGFTLSIPNGIAFDTGIIVAATTDSQGSGAPGANECFVNIGYA